MALMFRLRIGRSRSTTLHTMAVSILKEMGYRILERNFRTKLGEVDIIAEENKDLVFIEVKNRRNLSFGSPQSSVNLRKQMRLVRTALAYVKMKNLRRNIRFDIFAIEGRNYEVIRNAFISKYVYTY